MPHSVDVHVGNRVRAARAACHMSQEQLGKKLGISFQQVQKYEKGTNRIGASRLFEIAVNLGIKDMNYFYEGLSNAHNGDEIIGKRTIALAKKLETMPNSQVRDQILKLIDVSSKTP